jgi:hypothetical protein
MLAIDLLLTTDAQSRTVLTIAMGAAVAMSTMTLWPSFGRIVPAKIPESK